MGGGGGRRRQQGSGSGGGDGEEDDGVPPEEEPEDEMFPEGDRCEFHEEVTLDSPKAGPLGTISVGDVLPVELQQGAVVVLNDTGQVVGSIIEPWTDILKDCIEQGHDYEAEVLAIQGGSCDVLLRNA